MDEVDMEEQALINRLGAAISPFFSVNFFLIYRREKWKFAHRSSSILARNKLFSAILIELLELAVARIPQLVDD